MNIVKFHGGLGNQLFQYALYRKLVSLGIAVKADLRWYSLNLAETKRDFELEKFGIELDKCSKLDVWVKDNKMTKWMKKYFGISLFLYQEKIPGEFISTIYKEENKLLDGYWQTDRYFSDIRNILLEELVFPEAASDKEEKVFNKIKDSNSVSVHIRRGDYLNCQNKYGGICTEKYYDRAIQYVKEKVCNPTFFVFSDDIKWSRKFLEKYGNMEFVELGMDNNGIHDMRLMSNCNHNIIANSSFSWWGAWLNKASDKLVFAPSKWRNDCSCKDIVCENWIKISIDRN